MNVVKNILGEDYIFVKTQKFNTGYGTVGSSGVQVFRKRDNYYMGHFGNISEFMKERKYFAGIRR